MGIEIGLEVARHLVISMVFLGCSWHIGDAAGSDASLKVFFGDAVNFNVAYYGVIFVVFWHSVTLVYNHCHVPLQSQERD